MKEMKTRINALNDFILRYNEIRHTTEEVCKSIESFAHHFPSVVALEASKIQTKTLLYYQFLQLYFNFDSPHLAKRGNSSTGKEIFEEVKKMRKAIEKFPKEIFRYFWPNIDQNEYFIDAKLLHDSRPTFYNWTFSLSFLWCFLWGRSFRLYLSAPAGIRIDCDKNSVFGRDWIDWMKKIKNFFRVEEKIEEKKGIIIQNFFQRAG